MWKFNQSAFNNNRFFRKQVSKSGSLLVSIFFALAGLGSTLWVSTPARAQTATRANNTRVDVTVNRQPNESYETLIGRAETAMRNAVSRAFSQNPSIREVSVTILGQNAGEIAPILSLEVDRQTWASSRNVQRLATYLPNSRSLLGFATPGSPNNNIANQPQPTNAATTGRVLPNGVRILPNGTVVTGNGVQVLPNGTVVTNNGVTQVLPNGNVVSGNTGVQGVPTNPNFVPGTAARQVAPNAGLTNNVGQFNQTNPGVNNLNNNPANVGIGGFNTGVTQTPGFGTGVIQTPGFGTEINQTPGTGGVNGTNGIGGSAAGATGIGGSAAGTTGIGGSAAGTTGIGGSATGSSTGVNGVNGTTGVNGVNGNTGVGAF
ncbi:hypothetical protein ACE1B6_00420 [Aerosakkonemataceae cyanobacterium BLCC-F154]|uniref:Uncharacterized protein n=1 Tax=Floridaenema fluviatile BLCC-F154 TaxID=3153640 RepID=A0ABV4Y735_9CYAN